MSDITDAVAQDEIASSLMDAPIVGSWMDGALTEGGEQESGQDEAMDGRQESGQMSQTEIDQLARQVARPGESLQKEGQQQPPNQEEAQQPTELTPQSIHESLQALDTLVQEHGLNDAGLAEDFTDGFCQAFGVDALASGVDVQGLGSTMAKTALSAIQIYEQTGGDPTKAGAIPEQSAQAFTRDFLRSWGVDPREVQVNSQHLASTVLGGVLNFLDTYHRFGGTVQDVGQLNDASMAEFFLGNFLKAFGVEAQVDRGMALKFADAAGKYLLGFMGKLQQMQPQGASPRGRSQASRAPGRRQSSSRMQTNADIFSDDVLDQMANERMNRSGDAQEFARKPRSPRSPFSSNQDLFDGETMEAWYRDNGRL